MKRPCWDTTLSYLEPWPIKRILILSPEEEDSRISSRESEYRMLKPEFPIKDRKKKKEKERKRRIRDQRSEESKKEKIGGKQNNSRSIKETKKENRRSSNQINFWLGKWPPTKGKPISKWFFLCDCHSRSLLTGDVPPHINKEEKTETPSFLSKNTTLEKILLIRDRACNLLVR